MSYSFIITQYNTMLQGIVKFFNQEKGFGFIKYNGEQEIFVHITAVAGHNEGVTLHENDAVSFEIGDGKKGPMAVNVTVEGGASMQADDDAEDME